MGDRTRRMMERLAGAAAVWLAGSTRADAYVQTDYRSLSLQLVTAALVGAVIYGVAVCRKRCRRGGGEAGSKPGSSSKDASAGIP